MKTTLELPDDLFHQVKSTAAQRGVLMKTFITETLKEKLATSASPADPKPWMAYFGCMAKDPEMKEELHRINKLIEDEFGHVDPEDWK